MDIEAIQEAAWEAAIWQCLVYFDDESTGHLDAFYYEPADADREAFDDAVRGFVEEHAADIEASGLTDDQVGTSLTFNAYGHGAGFQDYGSSDVLDRLRTGANQAGLPEPYAWTEDGEEAHVEWS